MKFSRANVTKTTKHCREKLKKLCKHRAVPCVWTGRLAVKIPVLPKSTCRLNAVTIKDTRCFKDEKQ